MQSFYILERLHCSQSVLNKKTKHVGYYHLPLGQKIQVILLEVLQAADQQKINNKKCIYISGLGALKLKKVRS